MQKIIPVNAHTWIIDEGLVRYFLLEGETCALLVDSGAASPNAREIAQSVTKLPIRLFNTHADPDHISGNGGFEECLMGREEIPFYEGSCQAIPVSDGEEIDLGNRVLTVVGLPGHTPGSVTLLDREMRALIGGDPIQNGNIYMFGEKRNFPGYIESLENLWHTRREDFDLVYPSHSACPVQKDIIPGLIEGAKRILEGKIPGKRMVMGGRNIRRRSVGCGAFLCDIDPRIDKV